MYGIPSSRCNNIEAVTFHYHCTPCGGLFLYKYKDIYAGFLCRHKGAYKIKYSFFLHFEIPVDL